MGEMGSSWPPHFPVTVSELPEGRAGRVVARLSRRVAQLFGVDHPHNPYPLTWVADFNEVTLTDLSYGAPMLAKTKRRGESNVVTYRGHTHVLYGRNVAETTYAPIANATINKYSPDTKAAIILAAANCLFGPMTHNFKETLHSDAYQQLDTRERAAAYAGMIVGTYAAQPALFSAAVTACGIQRAHLMTSQVVWVGAPGLQGQPSARAEVALNAPPAPQSEFQPHNFDVVDATLPLALLAQPDRTDEMAGYVFEALRRNGPWQLSGETYRTAVVPADPTELVTAVAATLLDPMLGAHPDA